MANRPIEDVPLPGEKLPDARKTAKASQHNDERDAAVCPWHHGQCAYTGDEPDRCPVCHALWEFHPEKEHAEHIAGRMLHELDPDERTALRADAERRARHNRR